MHLMYSVLFLFIFQDHLKEMGVHAIGDRVYLIDMIGLLKKKKKELETSATLWSGETPATGFGKCSYLN